MSKEPEIDSHEVRGRCENMINPSQPDTVSLLFILCIVVIVYLLQVYN